MDTHMLQYCTIMYMYNATYYIPVVIQDIVHMHNLQQ